MTHPTQKESVLDSLLKLIDSIAQEKPKSSDQLEKVLGTGLTFMEKMSTPVARVFEAADPTVVNGYFSGCVFSLLPKNENRILFTFKDGTPVKNNMVIRKIGEEPRIIAANPANRMEQITYYVFIKDGVTVKFGFDLMKEKALSRLVLDYKR